jgi:hypothetical protein
MNNIIFYTILLIIVIYLFKSNIEKFAIDIGNTTPPSSNDMPGVSIGNTSPPLNNIPGVSIGNTTAQPPSNDTSSMSIGNTTAQPTSSIFDALSASIGNTTTPPASLPTGGILGGIMGNPSPSPASTNNLEAKVAAFCRSVQ